MKYLYALFLILIPLNLSSQTIDTAISYGVFSGLGFNLHSTDFKKVVECPSCSPGYRDGSGLGANFGFTVDIPLSDNFTMFNKLFFKSISAELIREESTKVVVESKIATGTFEHSFDATLHTIGIETGVKTKVLPNTYLGAGLQLSNLFSAEYSQVEKITKPANSATFLDAQGNDSHSRLRNKYSGDLESANSMLLALSVSASYKLPMNNKNNLFLEPEISYNLGLTDVISDDLVKKWKANSFNFAIAVKYSPLPEPPKKEEHKTIYKIDTLIIANANLQKARYVAGAAVNHSEIIENDDIILTQETISRTDTVFTPKKYILDARIEIVAVDKSNREIENPTIQVEEYSTTRVDPLLNYVFFDANSSELPARYKKLSDKELTDFEIDSLYNETKLVIYYNLLNIIGKRMQTDGKSKITLTGCNSDYLAEAGNKELSANRAETVKNYLVNVWGIDALRIKTQSRNLPTKPSMPKDEPDKTQENARVEIATNDLKLLEPVVISRIDRTAMPQIVRIKPTINAEAGLDNWKIEIKQKDDSKILFAAIGNKMPNNEIDWNMESTQEAIPQKNEPIVCTLTINDKKGNEKIVSQQTNTVNVVTIDQKRGESQKDFKIDQYSLMLFDFNKATIEDKNLKMVHLMSSKIAKDSEVDITGYSDRTGDTEHNKVLSLQRAESVKSALQFNGAVTKAGEKYLYDNDLPEGRFFCRTVEVRVKSPIK